MPDRQTVLVIGGGVIGGAISYELIKRGFDVTLVERGDFAGEASSAAAGLLGIQAEMFDGILPADVLLASQTIHRNWTRELEDISQVSVQYSQPGMLRIAFSAEEAERMNARAKTPLQDCQWLSQEQVSTMEPLVASHNFGGILFPRDAQLRPASLAKSLYTALLRSGCSVRRWMTVLSFIQDAHRIVGVRTTNGDLYADLIILAAGAWSSPLLTTIGLNLPVYPIKGQAYAVQAQTVSLRRIVQSKDVYIVPKLDGTLLIGATHEVGEFNKAPTPHGIAYLHHYASELVPSVSSAEFVTTWAGLRPASPDQLPYIGKPDAVEGLLVAIGHGSTGVMLAPMTAQVIADMVTGVAPRVNLEPFSPNRIVKTNA